MRIILALGGGIDSIITKVAEMGAGYVLVGLLAIAGLSLVIKKRK